MVELTSDKESQPLLHVLIQFARGLGPYLNQAVLVGGFVPLIYRFLPEWSQSQYPPLFTTDVDWTFPPQLALQSEGLLKDILHQEDLIIIPSRATSPPVHRIQHKSHGREQLHPHHAEFLVPLTGRGNHTDGTPKSPTKLQEGINAQALRYLDLLLHHPIEVDALSFLEDNHDQSPLTIRVPNPMTYILQKALCCKRRKRDEKRDKDLANIFDVAILTHSTWSDSAGELLDLRQEFHPRWLKRAAEILHQAFASPTAYGSLAVAQIYADAAGTSGPTPKAVYRVMNKFSLEVKL